jgi:hypothetical protein
MTAHERLTHFLQRARSRALLEVGMRAAGWAVAAWGLLFLALAVAARLTGPAASWPYVGFGSIALCVACAVALGYLRPARALEDPAAVARLVGEKRPSLGGDILSAVELLAERTGGAEVSRDMAQAFCATVADATLPIVVKDLIPLRRAARAVFAAGLSLLLFLTFVLAFPSAVGRGMRTLFRTPSLFEGAAVARDPLVGDVRVTYDFPAYTGLPRQVIEGSTGDLHALRGTRVHIEMRALRAIRQARLLMGDGGEEGSIEAQVNRGRLSVALDLLESGAYRIWLLPFLGRPVREDRAHRIVVDSDQPPEVDVVGPADRLELPVPRPVEVAYHARDDFGLAEVALVYRVNDGPPQRIVLKSTQGTREVRGTTSFEPGKAMLTPGARVAYHVEAKDRDEVSGSKVGLSRTLYLVIQNPREEREERLEHQRDLLDRLLAALADRIELEHPSAAMELPEKLARLGELHDGQAATLRRLGRAVEEQRGGGDAAKAVSSALGAASARLAKLMREEGEWLASRKLDRSAVWTRVHAQAQSHIAELENAVLALDDLIGRARLDDLAGAGKDLVAAHKRLQDLLERYRATGDEQLRRQIEREVRELRARIAELAHEIAQVKARNEVSPEWMNLPDTRKALEQVARFDSLLAKGDANSLSEALSELGDSLAALRDSLDQNADGFAGARFAQEGRETAELQRKIGDLEGDQRGLADDSQALAREVDAELARRREAQQASQRARVKQRLEQINDKLAGAPPRELGSNGEAAVEGIRENIRQLRRLLAAREWSEASRDTGRLGDGLSVLQHLSRRQVAQGRPPAQNLVAYDAQVGDATALARELAADLGRMVPRAAEVMSSEQRSQTRRLGQRQSSIEEKTRGLSREVGGREESVPGARQASAELDEIADQMRETVEDLGRGSPHEGAGRAGEIADRLARLRQKVGQRASAGAHASRELVRIPNADEYKAPREWRQELMEAMRERAPEKFRDEVRHYYEELVR